MKNKTRIFCSILILLLVFFFSIFRSNFNFISIDDLYIVFVYARHLVEQGSIYWNKEHVDGCTSFLDVILKSILYLINPDKMLINSVYLSCLFSFLTILLICLNFINLNIATYCLVLLSTISFALSPAFVESAISGMETSAYLFFSILSTILLSRTKDGRVLYLTLILFIWTISRPEALALAPLSIFYFLFFYRDSKRYKLILISFTCVLSCWLLWRLSYFGYIAPNTYFAKKSANRIFELKDGFNFITRHIPYSLSYLIFVQAAIILIACKLKNLWKDNEIRIKCLHCSLMFLICLGGIIFSGGDSYLNSTRFFLVPLGFITLATCLFFVGMNDRRLILLTLALTSYTVISNSVTCANSYRSKDYINFLFRYEKIAKGTTCEKELAQHLFSKFPNAIIGQEDFERLKFFEDKLNVIDLHGLNDVEIAHSVENQPVIWGKFNYEWPIKKNIDLWFPGPRFASPIDLSTKKIADVFDSAQSLKNYFGLAEDLTNKDVYLRNYTMGSIEACNLHYNFIIRKSLIELDYYRAKID